MAGEDVKISIPVAIILGAALIAGSVLITRGSTAGLRTQPAAETAFTVDGLKKLAKSLKLNAKDFNACLDSGKYADRVKRDLDAGTALGVDGTPSFFINGEMIQPLGAQPYALFKEYIDKTKNKEVELNPDDHVSGNPNAQITLIEYSDFECPFCLKFFKESYPILKQEYIDTGKIRFVYRHFMLPPNRHPMAEPSARASECAAEQGKFWEMHDGIFALQAK